MANKNIFLLVVVTALTGCCTSNRMALTVPISGGAEYDYSSFIPVVTNIVAPLGFERDDRYVAPQLEITSFKLLPPNNEPVIMLVIGHKIPTVLLVEYQRQRSKRQDLVRQTIESGLRSQYGAEVTFKELPCATPWP